MITPIEIQKTVFKTAAHGYSKSQVDEFKELLLKDYEALYRQNLDLTEKINLLNDKLQYYTSMEKSLHKALVLAEKSADETKRAAELNSAAVLKDARAQAQVILNDAKMQLNGLHDATLELMQQYETYKAQILAASNAQIQLLNSEAFTLDKSALNAYQELKNNKEKLDGRI